ncbi:MAG TPA: hypothetical protein VLF14_12325 [Candidatus Binatia bacterium]|nr:hypothetical protein [Candidatus Binatia bacterium]
MRTYVYEPRAGERVTRTFSGLVLYSEIFQQTDPIRRLAVQFASRGTPSSTADLLRRNL